MELMQAAAQFASRPDDQRYTSLTDLHAFTSGQRDRSQGKVVSTRHLTFEPTPGKERTHLNIVTADDRPAEPTHWSFGQVAQLAGLPAKPLRNTASHGGAQIIADLLNFNMKIVRDVEDVGVLLTQEDDGTELRAATGPNYGRIWNADVTRALVNKFGDGVSGDWKVPGEFGVDVPITKANTTLYASDRDLFVFLADERNRIEMPGRRAGKMGTFARGLFAWNSEVGSQSIGLAMFLFDYTCCNRIVWGAEGFEEIRLRHTVSAPDRWLEEISPTIIAYANAKASPVEAKLIAAQNQKLDDLDKFFASRKFTARDSALFQQAHVREEGRPIETVWDAVTGITAHAKSIPFQDERVALERAGGKLLDLVAA